MHKIIISILMMLSISLFTQAQSVQRQGNVFTQVSSSHRADTLVTSFTFEDSKGNKYPIIVNKNTGSCYIWRTSRNNRLYKSYMKPEISQQVCDELNIIYKPRKRN